ncbi:hypothetical protein OPT61_g3569 [Boeremia exigua]|uniref:Uncharacterized protein n=1 Tax=Boeremia exigua TaxID=749465 RepID=A0ACC2IHB0_9PLEO|nr:hypothetical protein OPT61_g3569 [Boeremia exigua]
MSNPQAIAFGREVQGSGERCSDGASSHPTNQTFTNEDPQALNRPSTSCGNEPTLGNPRSTCPQRTQTTNANQQANTSQQAAANALPPAQSHDTYTVAETPDAAPQPSLHLLNRATTPLTPFSRTPFPTPEDFDPLNQHHAPRTHRPLSRCAGCGTRLFHLPILADRAACSDCVRFG